MSVGILILLMKIPTRRTKYIVRDGHPGQTNIRPFIVVAVLSSDGWFSGFSVLVRLRTEEIELVIYDSRCLFRDKEFREGEKHGDVDQGPPVNILKYQ